jgi:hypothetical protein
MRKARLTGDCLNLLLPFWRRLVITVAAMLAAN